MQPLCESVWKFLETFAPLYVEGYRTLYAHECDTYLYSKCSASRQWRLQPPVESPISYPDDVKTSNQRSFYTFCKLQERQILRAVATIDEGVTEMRIEERSYLRDSRSNQEFWEPVNRLEVTSKRISWNDVYRRRIEMEPNTGRILQAFFGYFPAFSGCVPIPDWALVDFDNVRRWNTILSRGIRRFKERSAFKRTSRAKSMPPELLQKIIEFL